MTRARIHIICGNCGSNDSWKAVYDPQGNDVTVDEPKFEPSLHLACGNCSTLHFIDEIMELETK